MPLCLQNIVASLISQSWLFPYATVQQDGCSRPAPECGLSEAQLAAGQADSERQITSPQSSGCYPLFLSLSSGLQSHLPNDFKHPHISTGTLEKAISFLCIFLSEDLCISSHSLHQIDIKLCPSSACPFKCSPTGAPMGAANIISISQMEKQLTRAAPDTCPRP